MIDYLLQILNHSLQLSVDVLRKLEAGTSKRQSSNNTRQNKNTVDCRKSTVLECSKRYSSFWFVLWRTSDYFWPVFWTNICGTRKTRCTNFKVGSWTIIKNWLKCLERRKNFRKSFCLAYFCQTDDARSALKINHWRGLKLNRDSFWFDNFRSWARAAMDFRTSVSGWREWRDLYCLLGKEFLYRLCLRVLALEVCVLLEADWWHLFDRLLERN